MRSPSGNLNLIISITLKLRLNPKTALGSCEDWPKCPHNNDIKLKFVHTAIDRDVHPHTFELTKDTAE